MTMPSLRQPADVPHRFPSVAAFFDWAEHQPDKYELVDGVPLLLPWVKLNHARIVTNLLTLLASRIDRDALEVTAGDFAVQVGETSVRFADVMVFPSGKAGSVRTVDDAVLLVEVLSESTTHIDFGAKLREYLSLGPLRSYVVVDQDGICVWLWSRREDGTWPSVPVVLKGDSSLSLPVLGLELPLAEIYRGVN